MTVTNEHVTTDEPGFSDGADVTRRGRGRWTRLLAYAVLPGLILITASAVGYLKWTDGSARLADVATAQAVPAATDATIAMLSYRPDTVASELPAVRDRLTGAFRDQYTQLITDVVIPGAQQKQISAVATVPAAAVVSATADHAVVVVYIDQKTTIGGGPPSDTGSSARVTLDKLGGRWLVSNFEPI